MPSFLVRPKWIGFHLVVLGGLIAMISAADWQWTKYGERKDFVATVRARQDRDRTPPQPLTVMLDNRSLDNPALDNPGVDNGSLDRPLVGELEYRIATARGRYLATGQLTQINRSQDGVIGVNVLTPFQIDGGPVVIVNRGFVPDGSPLPQPPGDALVIGGTVRASEQRRTGQLTDNESGAVDEVRRVDLALIGDRLDLGLAPVYLDLIASEPPAAQPPVPVPPPSLSGGPPHLSYATQWLIFSLAVIVGWVLVVRRTIRAERTITSSADAERRGPPSA